MTERVIQARALPRCVRLAESYFYEQDISSNPLARMRTAPTGAIEIVVPFDGHHYFTRQACADVEHQIGSARVVGRVEAQVGHLALSNHDRTNISDVVPATGDYDSAPLRIPIAKDEIPDTGRLSADRHASATLYDYSPLAPDIVPIEVRVTLLDEDMLEFPSLDYSTRKSGRQLERLVEQVAQQVNFRRNLLLVMDVRVNVDASLMHGKPNPSLTRTSLSWPAITSFHNLHFYIGDPSTDGEVDFTYNPVTRSLELSGSEMHLEARSAGDNLETFVSKTIFFLVDEPGELYQQGSLSGEVEVTLPGTLLSGLQARVFDGCGSLRPDPGPQMTTRVSVRYTIRLDDAFSRRTHSPYQHLHFDELAPDPMRIVDIRTALIDRGFQINDDESGALGGSALQHLVVAERLEGSEPMKLWIFVDGKRYELKRKGHKEGGRTYISTVESGELKMYLRGQLRGGSLRLIEEMNTLHSALRDRFDRQRTRL